MRERVPSTVRSVGYWTFPLRQSEEGRVAFVFVFLCWEAISLKSARADMCRTNETVIDRWEDLFASPLARTRAATAFANCVCAGTCAEHMALLKIVPATLTVPPHLSREIRKMSVAYLPAGLFEISVKGSLKYRNFISQIHLVFLKTAEQKSRRVAS